ncbi:MAG TPA: hypothetical protein VK808_11495 [Bacteroidia bacterium]|nr:hypothetical protein [Bacteroidia bacterium]
MNKYLLILSIFVCLFISNSIFAQELVFYDLDDYIDPSIFSVLKLDTTFKAPKTFFNTVVYGGIDCNYQYRTDFSKPSIDFARLTNNFYCSHLQANVKTFVYDNLNNKPSFSCLNQIQIGLCPILLNALVERYQITWNYLYNHGERQINDFSIDIGLKQVLGYGFNVKTLQVTGGFIFDRNFVQNENYWGWAYRYRVCKFKNGSDIKVGYELKRLFINRVDIWCLFKTDIECQVFPANSNFNSIHLVASYSRNFYMKKNNFEIGAFFDISAIAK